ncbi:MAG: hypothetical protein R6V17_09120 [Halanaerobacter sp.]
MGRRYRMYFLYLAAGIGLVISTIFDYQKTVKALKMAWKKFSKILPGYIKILIILSVVLLIPEETIVYYLGGGGKWFGLLSGLFLGSVTMIPGFISYPLAGILVEKGVSYMVVAAFVTTLMMVGVATYPVEKEYYGHKATIIRNIVSLIIAAIIALSMGIIYGEVF